jgi:hypothetical protein
MRLLRDWSLSPAVGKEGMVFSTVATTVAVAAAVVAPPRIEYGIVPSSLMDDLSTWKFLLLLIAPIEIDLTAG